MAQDALLLTTMLLSTIDRIKLLEEVAQVIMDELSILSKRRDNLIPLIETYGATELREGKVDVQLLKNVINMLNGEQVLPKEKQKTNVIKRTYVKDGKIVNVTNPRTDVRTYSDILNDIKEYLSGFSGGVTTEDILTVLDIPKHKFNYVSQRPKFKEVIIRTGTRMNSRYAIRK